MKLRDIDGGTVLRIGIGAFSALNIALLVFDVMLISYIATDNSFSEEQIGNLPPSKLPFRGVTSAQMERIDELPPGMKPGTGVAPRKKGGSAPVPGATGLSGKGLLGLPSDFGEEMITGGSGLPEGQKEDTKTLSVKGLNTTERYAIFLETMIQKLEKAAAEKNSETIHKPGASEIASAVAAFKEGDRDNALSILEDLRKAFTGLGVDVPPELNSWIDGDSL